jgi:AraC-like DNA-binding protein
VGSGPKEEAELDVVKTQGPPSGAGRSTTESLNFVAKFAPCLRVTGALDRQKPFLLNQRAGTLGPIGVFDLTFNGDTCIHSADDRPYYQVNVLASGQMEMLHSGSLITDAQPGLATIFQPEKELIGTRWKADSRLLVLRVNRDALEDALSEALGRPLATQIDFGPSMVTTKGAARTWMHMFTVFAQELFRVDGALTHPLVASPFVDGLLHALLLAADHPYRSALGAQAKWVPPRIIRPAVDIIEAEPHLPLTVASLAARCHVSSRALQQGFVRHMDMSPMTYLRQVRLRRAHQDLLASDPSVETVASIAKRWGYTNPGRFAAAHAATYGEIPAVTLHRSVLGNSRTDNWPAPVRSQAVAGSHVVTL